MMNVITWLTSHQLVLGGGAVAVLDFLFALVPSIASNGIVHFVYLQAKKLAGG